MSAPLGRRAHGAGYPTAGGPLQIHPVSLPDLNVDEPEYGLLRTLLFVGVYLALLVGAVVYIVLKLPRRDETPPAGTPGDEQGDN